MEKTILLWMYIVNTIFLINHEIDSSYWHEWKLFNLKGGITMFLIVHFPMWLAVLYGLVEVVHGTFAGMVFSLVLAAVGIFAFCIHTYFIKKGHNEFTTVISRFILVGMLCISIGQLLLTIYVMCMSLEG